MDILSRGPLMLRQAADELDQALMEDRFPVPEKPHGGGVKFGSLAKRLRAVADEFDCMGLSSEFRPKELSLLARSLSELHSSRGLERDRKDEVSGLEKEVAILQKEYDDTKYMKDFFGKRL